MSNLQSNLSAMVNATRLSHGDTWQHWLNGLISAVVKSGMASVKAVPGLAVGSAAVGSMKTFLVTAGAAFVSGAVWEFVAYLNANALPPVFDVSEHRHISTSAEDSEQVRQTTGADKDLPAK